MTSIAELKKELAQASQIKEPALRGVSIAAVLADALLGIQQNPILVGGAAVEFYTQGGYSTEDIDMITPGGPELAKVMKDLGFKKIGKDFFRDDLKIYVEFPGSALGTHERFILLRIGHRELRIISQEDLIVDRLCSFKFWESAMDGKNALMLLETSELDRPHLLQRAQEEQVLDALDAIENLREELIRKKISGAQAKRTLEKQMRSFKK